MVQKNELKLKLSELLDKVCELYPKKQKPASISANISHAKSILKAKKTTVDDYKQEIELFNKIIKKKRAADKKEADQIQAKLNEQAKEEQKALDNPKSINDDDLEKLAQYRPDPKTCKNIFRPDWTYYDTEKNCWRLDANKLASEIAEDQQIRRVEEKGKVTDYTRYNYLLGQWEIIAPDDLGNFIDDYFQRPQVYQHSENNMFAEDLHSAKAVRDTLTLLKSKIKKIDAAKFDQPPKYLVHCKNFDFDILHWKKVPFSPDHYFVSGLRFNPDAAMLTAWDENQKQKAIPEETFIQGLAPKIQQWLYLSLGKDKTTVKAFIERLGLSMIHDYDSKFIVFVQSARSSVGKSKLFTFLGSLFQDSARTALDLDMMAEKGSFDAQELRYHDINLTSEVKTRFISDVALNVLKGLSGGDTKDFSQKFKGTARFKNTDHLWFNMNYLPRLSTYDDATATRFDIYPWQRIPNFDKKFDFADFDKERPELVLLAMIYAHECLTRPKKHFDYCHTDLRITRSQAMIDAYQEWAQTNDLFTRFIKEKCSPDPSYKIGVGYLTNEFNKYLDDNGEGKIHYHTNDLANKLNNINVTESDKISMWTDENGKAHRGVYVFKGITLKSIAPVTDEKQQFDQEQAAKGKKRVIQMNQRSIDRNQAYFGK